MRGNLGDSTGPMWREALKEESGYMRPKASKPAIHTLRSNPS